ncbi:MAG: hypothetical protein NWF01_05790 [Candidatus Bathyarchaeota archaeon]|nr:hypothetical protein [Candidatus Bathyarchaeota archaeon]
MEEELRQIIGREERQDEPKSLEEEFEQEELEREAEEEEESSEE